MLALCLSISLICIALYGGNTSASSPILDLTLGSSSEVNLVSLEIPISEIFELSRSESRPVR